MSHGDMGPLVSSLVGGAVIYLLMRAGNRPAPQVDGRRVVRFGASAKVFAVVLVAMTVFIVYAASHARAGQGFYALLVSLAFVLAAPFVVYQVFFVSLAYDDEYIYYRSPLAGRHVIPWDEVTDVGYSRIAGAHYLRTVPVRRIWCSNMQIGFAELGEFLSRKCDEMDGANG